MKRTKSAFTLIELLVVIAIIGMLLAIIMPGLKKAKDAGRTVVCAAQLKQFGLAWYFYAQDNDDSNLWYAPSTEWDKGKFWFYQLAAYFGDTEFAQGKGDSISGVMKIMRCPSTTAWKDAYGDGFGYGTSTQAWRWRNLDPTTQSKLHEGSYTLNGWMQDRSNNTDSRFYRKYTQSPATAPLLTDGGWVDAWPVPGNAQLSSTLMDLHGGGYMFGPFRPEWTMVAKLASATDCDFALLGYPKAPEHGAAETVGIARQAYSDLINRYGASNVILVGSSAGGGLAVVIMAALRDADQPQR